MEKIIIVDDEKSIGSGIMRLLTDHGYAGEVFSEPQHALDYLENDGAADVILLDVWMPEISGYEFMQKIHENHRKIPVIVMSGHANVALSTESLKGGAVDFLEKPFSPQLLLSKLQNVLQKKTIENKKQKSTSKEFPGLTQTEQLQCTIKKNVVLKGIGLHSGEHTGLILSPLPSDSGVVFADIATGKLIPALASYVSDMHYAVTLEDYVFKVRVIEHLMAALHIYGIDNVLVKVSNEVPIMDGSAAPFCALLEDAGIQEQNERKSVFVVQETFVLRDEQDERKFIQVEPYAGLAVSYKLDLPRAYGKQAHEVVFTASDRDRVFKNEIAPCRTFGFLDETRDLQSEGMALGANLENALLLHENKVVNSELRFKNEFARHKIIDILGDFYLLGAALVGRIRAEATGHRHNVGLIRKILSEKK